MIESFASKETEKIFLGEISKKLPIDIQRTARRKLLYLDEADSLQDVQAVPGNRFERLKGDRTGQYSIRVNDQWRICFEWAANKAQNVEAAANEMGVRLVSPEKLIHKADFLSLHLPLSPDTNGRVDAEFLGRMKPGAFLVNTSRGELIDEGALFEALQKGYLRGAALDVFAKQPPEPDNPLLSLSQVITTPHMGAHTDGATNAMGWGALNACLAVLRGEEPCHRVV